jgi:hypothetical protein
MSIIYSLIMTLGGTSFVYACVYDLLALYEREIKRYFESHGLTIISIERPTASLIKANFTDDLLSVGTIPFFPNHFRTVTTTNTQGQTRLYIIKVRSWYFKKATVVSREL